LCFHSTYGKIVAQLSPCDPAQYDSGKAGEYVPPSPPAGAGLGDWQFGGLFESLGSEPLEEEVLPSVPLEEEALPSVPLEEEVLPSVPSEEESLPSVPLEEEVLPIRRAKFVA